MNWAIRTTDEKARLKGVYSFVCCLCHDAFDDSGNSCQKAGAVESKNWKEKWRRKKEEFGRKRKSREKNSACTKC